MQQVLELSPKKSICSYCGEAPVNHAFYFFEKLISFPFDLHTATVIKYTPRFVKNFVDRIPVFLFRIFVILKLGHFSSDINKANSFRSRVIWEEANRRGIQMEQIIIGERPLDWYRAKVDGKNIYFESIPIQPEFLDFKKDWDNKITLKEELLKYGVPVPNYIKLSFFPTQSLEKIFLKFKKPLIIKPQTGSRARHTVTNIRTFTHFKNGIIIAKQISPYLVVEEHLEGYICRATIVSGVLAGFYRGSVPNIVGDGQKTIKELIEEKNKTQIDRYHVRILDELHDHIARSGFTIEDILPKGISLSLSHRAGQLFGGRTIEMIDDLHPSFIPILEKATKVVGLSVVGFDAIIPDPTKPADSQRWGIIECNTLPFIDVHYYALEGKPRNIAGMIWDMWQ